MMKATAIAILLTLLSCSAQADLDIRSITPANAKKLNWKIEVHPKGEYIQFTVQPPSPLVSERRSAHLIVNSESKMVSVSLLGLHKVNGTQRYEFAVANSYVKSSVFELGPDDESITDSTTSFRLLLRDFEPAEEKETGPQQTPGTYSSKAANGLTGNAQE